MVLNMNWDYVSGKNKNKQKTRTENNKIHDLFYTTVGFCI